MVNLAKKPYEISIWEDRLVTENGQSYYKEVKLAVIGSDTMNSPNKVFNPILTETVNGEKTLIFSLAYKYYDSLTEEMVNNPFGDYLINERKIKLFFNDKWYEFLIKECSENSEDYIFTYTARERFTLELSRVGYNIELIPELNNNQGTILELGQKALEGTDWVVDEENSDLLKQFIQEPIYQAIVTTQFTALNLDNNENEVVEENEIIYIFYKFIKNNEVNNIQFIRERDRNNFIIDDNNVIQSTNYRILDNLITNIENNIYFSLENIYLSNQGYRLAYGPRTTYDPIKQRTVEIYNAEYNDSIQEIYHYIDYEYTTSDVVTSFITNGENFELYEDGSLQGWSDKTYASKISGTLPTLQPLQLTTVPKIASDTKLSLIRNFADIKDFIKLKFNGTLQNDYSNTFFNSGFNDNFSLIDHITTGEEFVLRLRAYSSDETENLLPIIPTSTNAGVRAVVAKYDMVDMECYLDSAAAEDEKVSKINAYKINPEGIILDFNQSFTLSRSVVNSGEFNINKTSYIVDGVIQTPSSKYIYTSDNENFYTWNSDYSKYEPLDTSKFADYYFTTALAQYSISNKELTDVGTKIGIFLYTKDENLADKYIYISDIQLTRCYRTSENTSDIVTIGNIPTATSIKTNYFYLKPVDGMTVDEINTYSSLDFLANELKIDSNLIHQVYNSEGEKILSIQESQSNCFNILQSLCEVFECWLDIEVEYEENGEIKLDKEFNPIKKIAFKQYAGKDNFAGFRKGINLSDINRNIDSEEIVTKLIVDPVQNQYSDTGTVSIQYADANPSKEAYILNFSYYLNRGLIPNTEDCNADLFNFYDNLRNLNQQIIELSNNKEYLEMSLLKLRSNRTVISTMIEEAKIKYNEKISEFYDLTGYTFEEYSAKYHNAEEWATDDDDNLIENESIVEVVGNIYTNATIINNYSGQLTNLDSEYKEIELECYGARDYSISVTCIPPVQEIDGSTAKTNITIDDYISGIEFQLSDGTAVETYNSSLVNRVFNITSVEPYKTIIFTHIPDNYILVYYENNKAIKVNGNKIQFKIYDEETNEVVNRRFKLVPNEDYALLHPGITKNISNFLEDKKQLEKNFYKKYSRFIQEGTWNSQDYIDSELYYLDALQVSNTSAQPKVSYTINVVEISQLEGLENYDFRIGDKSYVEDIDFFGKITEAVPISSLESFTNIEEIAYEDLPRYVILESPVREEVIVSEIEWHLDKPDENVVIIQNYKTQFEDLFQRLSATVQTVQYNEATYPKTSTILDQNGLINSTLLANSLSGAAGLGFALTSNGTVQTTNEGLLIRNLTNPANLVRIVSGGIQVSEDGGQSWGTAISAKGISADELTAGTINTKKVWLMDGDNPSFRWDKSGLNAYGLETKSNGAYNLKTYVRFDKYGLYGIKNGEDYIAGSLADIKNKAFFGVTWDGFFIRNNYTDGYISISSDKDIEVVQNGIQKIHIGAVERNVTGAPTKYGINIKNNEGDVVFDTGDDGNLKVTGTINALAGNFMGKVRVGDVNRNHIIIDGEAKDPVIQSANYQDGGGLGWIINGKGDATFSNVSVRGAIKTAVFEYEEIQAVGGAFLFRPSSTIKNVRYEPSDIPVTVIMEDGTTQQINTYYHTENNVKIYQDLILTVEKPLIFRENHWCKISNYNSEENIPTAETLSNYGLVHIYRISDIDTEGRLPYNGADEEERIPATYEITLENGAALLDTVLIDEIVGGALIDFGATNGLENYGIGINSSDNYINLPRRAISLFETEILTNDVEIGIDPRIIYNYRAILGTLPTLQYEGANAQVSSIYNVNMKDTQGIYTDNMYIGDNLHYIAFYTDKNDSDKKKLRIAGADIVFTYDDGHGSTTEKTLDDRIDEIEAGNGEDAAVLVIDSSEGNVFRDNQGSTDLTVSIFYGSNVITNSTQLTNIFGIGAYLEWEYKNNTSAWVTLLASDPRISDNGFTVSLSAEDVYNKANFRCKLVI